VSVFLCFRIEVSFSLAYGDLASDFLSDVVRLPIANQLINYSAMLKKVPNNQLKVFFSVQAVMEEDDIM